MTEEWNKLLEPYHTRRLTFADIHYEVVSMLTNVIARQWPEVQIKVVGSVIYGVLWIPPQLI